MKFTKQGDWLVSTPIVAGTAAQVGEAARCAHASWREASGDQKDGTFTIVESCTKCCATRVRSKEVE